MTWKRKTCCLENNQVRSVCVGVCVWQAPEEAAALEEEPVVPLGPEEPLLLKKLRQNHLNKITNTHTHTHEDICYLVRPAEEAAEGPFAVVVVATADAVLLYQQIRPI